MTSLERRLESATADHGATEVKAAQLRDRRDTLIREALAEGWTHQRIKDVTGLSRGRIAQIKAEGKQ